MTTIIDFNRHHKKVKPKPKQEVFELDDADYIKIAKEMELIQKVNESLMYRTEWISQNDGVERSEKIVHFYKLINCKEFTYSEHHDPIMNTYIKKLTKWDLFKLLIGLD